MRKLAYLNKYLWKYRLKLSLGVLFIIITNLFAVYTPTVVREAFDLVKEAGSASGNYTPTLLTNVEDITGLSLFTDLDFSNKESVVKSTVFLAGMLAIFYILLFLVKGFFLFLTRQTIIIMSREIEYDLKNEIFKKYQTLSQAFYKRNNTGDLMNRISEDVSQVRMYVGPCIMYTINLVFLFIFTVSFMLRVNVELTLYVLIPLPIMSVLIYFVSRQINKRSTLVQEQQSNLSTLAQESFSGIRVLKAYSKEAQFTGMFTAACDMFKKRSLDLVRTEALFHPIIILLIGLSTILTIYIGGLKAIAGEISIGNIAEFVIYVNMLTWPFAAVGWVTSLTQRAAASQKRINEFLNTPSEIVNTNEETLDFKGKLEFKQVSFTYTDSGTKALRDVSFTVNSGETLAIVGKTGSGKSTIANLICRHYDPSSGEIIIDKTSLKNHNLNQLRSEIGYVPQDVFLFSDSIASNIKFGVKGNVEMAEIEQAAKDAHILHNISEFKEGFNTMLGERGITLSGGQKQRVSIARAIIKKPSLLIFDDCLSAVDTETEETILRNLSRIMENRTSIIISHRISTVQNADKIIVLEDGEIAESGSHEELLKQEGLYYNTYQQQLTEEAVV